MKPICTCEDYPCCGHSSEERRMTQKQQDKIVEDMVKEAMEEEFL